LFRPKNRKIFRDEINTLKKQALKTPKRGVIAALEGMKNRQDREILLKFAPYPIHFVIGKKDPVLPYTDLMDQTKNGSFISYTLFEEIGHMGFIEAREACLKDLRKFIARC
jgi:pimeloyl-ACP methyl ester carboxylesterase